MKPKNRFFFLMIFVLSMAFSLNSNANIIIRESSPTAKYFLLVTRDSGNMYFEKCAMNENADCVLIGNENGYPESLLRNLQRNAAFERNVLAVVGSVYTVGMTAVVISLGTMAVPAGGLALLNYGLMAQGGFLVVAGADSFFSGIGEAHRMANSMQFILKGEESEIIVPSLEKYESDLFRHLKKLQTTRTQNPRLG